MSIMGKAEVNEFATIVYGLRVVERLPIEIPATDANREYLRTKRDKLGHILSVVSPRDQAS